MKAFFFALVILSSIHCCFAQQASIVLQSGNTTRFFNTLNEAYVAAANGDFIYLPGGSFRMDNALNKQLNIYGVGWRSDSSAAVNGPTYIVTNFYVNNSGSNSIISGLSMPTTGVILSDSIRTFTVERSKLHSVTYQNNGAFTNSLFVNECVLNYIYPPRYGITEMNHCIVNQGANSGNYNFGGILKFKNSVMLNFTNDRTFDYLGGLELSNSIIFVSQVHGLELLHYVTVLGVNNTLFIGEANRINISLAGTGNLRKEQGYRDNIFAIYTGGGVALENDFHPKAVCNCADRGVYSGMGKFRAIPPIHIASKNVQTSTNNNFLKFTFRVQTDN